MVARCAVLLSIVVTWSLTVAPAAGAAGERPRSVLEGVPGLEKRVTYTETKIPLGELVQKVAADTGVALTAHRDVADEPVAVIVKELPARELLEQIAEWLDYRWSRKAGVRGQGTGVGAQGSGVRGRGSVATQIVGPRPQTPDP